MQTNLFKFFKKITLIFFVLTQVTDSQAQRKLNLLADSLFKQRNFVLAEQNYHALLDKNIPINPSVYLKLAFINENNQKFPEELYYLSQYFSKKPNELVFDKMNSIAEQNNYKGYEKNDLNFLILIYRRYTVYFTAAFLLLGLYIFSVLVYKKVKKQSTSLRHYLVFLLYLTLLFLLINLPNTYRSVIIKHPNTYLRDYPSAASPIEGKISEGHKLNVLNSEDIWYRVLWNGKLVYIKSSDVWLIN